MNDVEQFEALVSEHYEPLFKFAMSLTRRESDARDLTQETVFVWATKGHQLRDLAKVRTWLFTTLHRAFLQTCRRRDRFPDLVSEGAPEEASVPFEEPSDEESHSRVLRALGRVDEVYRVAVSQFYLDDRSYAEIADGLDVPLGTVKSRIARGLAQLRAIMVSEAPMLPRIGSDWDSSPTVVREQLLEFWLSPGRCRVRQGRQHPPHKIA